MSTQVPERLAVISGVGQSAVGRRLNRSGMDLTIDAALAAIADAGIDPSEIDGISSWPGFKADTPGFSPVAIGQVKDALGLKLNWYNAGIEATQMAGVQNACMAVAAGQARHVLCFRTVTETSGLGLQNRASLAGAGGERVTGFAEYLAPFLAPSGANWVGLVASRYFHEFGAKREQLAQIALTARRNAALNPNAVYREPLSLEQYMASRMISTPLCLYDCDIPVDGSIAVIVSHRDTARDLKSTPIRIEAISGALHTKDSWDQLDDLTRYSAEACGRRLWSRTDLKPSDVDVAQLYDGFSMLTLLWLEGLGFCGRGEAADFVGDGSRIALDGDLPMQTGGGQLSGGRLHGMIHIVEAVTQLRGLGQARQVAGAPKVAVVSNGGGPIAGAMLLVRD
jgi:acetyl-CoA acetyltransferase